MTKTEGSREILVGMICRAQRNMCPADVCEQIDRVIAAAREEGRAEERERIRQNLKQRGFKNEAPDGIEYWNIDEDSLFSLNLAPATKEEVKP